MIKWLIIWCVKFPDPMMTFLNVLFCPRDSQKPKDIEFIITEE